MNRSYAISLDGQQNGWFARIVDKGDQRMSTWVTPDLDSILNCIVEAIRVHEKSRRAIGIENLGDERGTHLVYESK